MASEQPTVDLGEDAAWDNVTQTEFSHQKRLIIPQNSSSHHFFAADGWPAVIIEYRDVVKMPDRYTQEQSIFNGRVSLQEVRQILRIAEQVKGLRQFWYDCQNYSGLKPCCFGFLAMMIMIFISAIIIIAAGFSSGNKIVTIVLVPVFAIIDFATWYLVQSKIKSKYNVEVLDNYFRKQQADLLHKITYETLFKKGIKVRPGPYCGYIEFIDAQTEDTVKWRRQVQSIGQTYEEPKVLPPEIHTQSKEVKIEMNMSMKNLMEQYQSKERINPIQITVEKSEDEQLKEKLLKS